MALSNIISSVARDFINQADQHILYLSLSPDSMKEVASSIEGAKYTVDLKDNLEPVKPYMQLVSFYKPSEEIIGKNAYSLQRQSFVNYFATGDAGKRTDVLLSEEVFYEEKRARTTLIRLFETLVKDVVVVLNAQEMSREAIALTQEIEQSRKFKGKIIFCFNQFVIDDSTSDMRDFIEQICDNSNYFSISSEIKDGAVEEKPLLFDFDALYKALVNCTQFICFNQAKSIREYITKYQEELMLTTTEHARLYLEMAKCGFYNGDSDNATFLLNNVIENEKDEYLLGRAYFWLGNVLIYKNAYGQARKYYNMALQSLENFQDSLVYALTYAALYRMNDHNGNGDAVDEYHHALKLLEAKNLKNNQVNISLVMPWELVNYPSTREQLKENIDKGIKYAIEIDNKFALSTAYHWKGILISRGGDADGALEWYSKCSDIRAENCALSDIVKIRNGLSYEYLTRAEYEKAYDYINSFIARIEEINDYSEVIITLKNIAFTLLYSRHFEEASALMVKMLRLMRLFNLGEVSFNAFLPEMNDLLIYAAVISICQGDVVRARIAFHNVSNNGKPVSLAAASFKLFLESMIALYDKDFERSTQLFEKAGSFAFDLGAEQKHHVCFLDYEYGLALYNSGYEKEGLYYCNRGNGFAMKNNLGYFIHENDDNIIEEYLYNVKQFKPMNIDLNLLEENAQKAKLMNQLHKRLRDSQFLNKITSLGSDSKEEKKYAASVVDAIYDFITCDGVYIAEKNGTTWKTMAGITRNGAGVPGVADFEFLYRLSQEKNHEQLFNNPERKMIFGSLSKYEFTGAIIIVPNDQTTFTAEDRSILNIAISNLQAQLVMIKQNKHLLFISSTDQLSMLNNRRALQEHILVESEMTRRYEHKRNIRFQVTISFIDLDNFKYYNDTFGHEAGDLLIMKFSALLKQVYRRVDFVSRFGGDEFVVLLPNTNPEEARRAAERVHEELDRQHHFIPDLEEMMNKSLAIPENKYLGFSTGLCSNQDIENTSDLERVMINADHALYYAKKHCKGSVILFSDIKDKVLGTDDESV